MTTWFDHLAQIALVGAGSAAPPPRPAPLADIGCRADLSAEEALLDEAALALIWEISTVPAALPTTVAARPCPAETRPVCTPAAAACLRRLLEEAPKAPPLNLAGALARLVAAERRVPDDMVPSLLSAAREYAKAERDHPGMLSLILAATGELGPWLCRQSPVWRLLGPFDDADLWDSDDAALRLNYLGTLRRRDPAAAASLLRDAWKSFNPKKLADAVPTFIPRAGSWDEPVARLALASRSKDLQVAGRRLAMAIPGMPEGEEALGLAAALWHGQGFVTSGEALGRACKAFGVEEPEHPGSHWLALNTIFAMVPPSRLARRLGVALADLVAAPHGPFPSTFSKAAALHNDIAAWEALAAMADLDSTAAALLEPLQELAPLLDDPAALRVRAVALLSARMEANPAERLYRWYAENLCGQCLDGPRLSPAAAEVLALSVLSEAPFSITGVQGGYGTEWARAASIALPAEAAGPVLKMTAAALSLVDSPQQEQSAALATLAHLSWAAAAGSCAEATARLTTARPPATDAEIEALARKGLCAQFWRPKQDEPLTNIDRRRLEKWPPTWLRCARDCLAEFQVAYTARLTVETEIR